MNTENYYQLIAVLISLLIPVVLTNENKIWLKRLSLVALLMVAGVISILTFIDNANAKNPLPMIIAVSIFDVLYVAIAIWGFCATLTTMSPKKMDKIISKFTAEAASGSTIRIFGGDLNFLGDVTSESKDDYIGKNAQFQQIVEMATRNTKYQILCLKPTNEEHKKRIGYLAKNCQNIEIMFYQSKQSSKDSNCGNCEMLGHCKHCQKYDCCEILKNLCVDLNFRGRIVTQNNDASFVFVANWLSGRKRYEKIKIFKPNTRECNFYVKYWDYLWGRAQEYNETSQKIIEECEGTL